MARRSDDSSPHAAECHPVLTGWRLSRAGVTLAELLVALTLTAIILGSATTSVLRQRRTASTIGGAAVSAAQLRAATGALAAELSPLTAASGDLVPGEARDTSLQLRTLVATGVVCDDAVGFAVIASEDGAAAGSFSGAVPKTGDSLWWYSGDSTAYWRGRLITASDSILAVCPLLGSGARPARHLAFAERDTVPLGASLRVTRPARYSFYRSGVGGWYLGLGDWVEATRRFASPQPIAGPFLMRVRDARSGFRFFGSDGVELVAGASGVDAARIARVRLTVLVADRTAFPRDTVRRDSMDVALLPPRVP